MIREQSRYVVVVGTSTVTRGGIGAVLSSYERAGFFRRWPTIHLVSHTDGSMLRKGGRALIAFGRLAYLLFWHRVLLVHVHSASDASFWRKSVFMVASFIARRPVIFHLHGGGFMDFYESRCGASRKWLVRAILDRVAAIIVLTEEWRTRISDATSNQNIEVIFNPVDARSLSDASGSSRFECTLLFLGRLEKDKGIHDLLETLVIVREPFPEVTLWLAGEGDRGALADHIKSRGLCRRIRFLGWVGYEGKKRLLSQATVFVLPSHVEGLPMAVLEAMAAGLPVVATNVGGIPSVVEEGVNGFLVRPGDIRALADAICVLLSDRDLRQRMGAASRRKINAYFLPERVTSQIDSLYRKVLRIPSAALPVDAAPVSPGCKPPRRL